MIGLSWDNFDKAFWVSSTNIHNLINGAINIDINIGAVERDLNNAYSMISSVGSSISDLEARVAALEAGGGGGGGGSIDPMDPLYVNLDQRVKACERAIEAHGHDISDLKVDVIKLDARVSALEGK